MRTSILAFAIALSGQTGMAQDIDILGIGRLFSNDVLGDGHDRWRSGSSSFSLLTGNGWTGNLTGGPVLEYRLRSDIIMPGAIDGQRSDRPFVGAVSMGLHHHVSIGPTEVSVGADLVLVGPQTGLSDFQIWSNDLFSIPAPLGVESQLGNAIYAAGTADVVWPIALGPTATLRPFVEAQAGVENSLRAGMDIVLGPVGQHDLWLRDGPTGQLYRGIQGAQTGFGFVVGADIARMNNSVYLPEDMGYIFEPMRLRARAGLHWQPNPGTSLFYGVAWLTPEFEGQEQGQLIGQIKLNFNF